MFFFWTNTLHMHTFVLSTPRSVRSDIHITSVICQATYTQNSRQLDQTCVHGSATVFKLKLRLWHHTICEWAKHKRTIKAYEGPFLEILIKIGQVSLPHWRRHTHRHRQTDAYKHTNTQTKFLHAFFFIRTIL